MTDPTTDRPLVTFALFAYNQEKYIREAVEGAFSQTYEPLEIILSDDCSSDRTFEIMQEMAAAYEGPHRVSVRQSEINVGTLSHVLQTSRAANGLYFVVAAGDDISKPERTKMVVKLAACNDWCGLSSACDEFREGNFETCGMLDAIKPIKLHILRHSPVVQQIHGASSVYRTAFLRKLPLPKDKVFLEDFVLQTLAHVKGCKVGRVESSLIFRRIHEDNIGPGSLARKEMDVLKMERKIVDHYKRMLPSLKYIELAEKEMSSLDASIQGSVLDSDAKRYCELRASWLDSGPLQRFQLASLSRKFGSPRRDMLRALGPTIFTFVASAAEKKEQWKFLRSVKDRKA